MEPVKNMEDGAPQAIFKACMDLISQKGVNNITIRDISIKAHTALQTLYLYFHSKNHIFGELYLDNRKKLERHLANEFRCSIFTQNDFVNMIRLSVYYYLDHPKEMLIMELHNNRYAIRTESTSNPIEKLDVLNSLIIRINNENPTKKIELAEADREIMQVLVGLTLLCKSETLTVDSALFEGLVGSAWKKIMC